MWIWLSLALATPPTGGAVAIDVQTMAVGHDGTLHSDTRTRSYGSFDVDLDGDGLTDRAVPVFADDACPWTLRYTVWWQRGEGWTKAGEVVGVPQRVDGALVTLIDRTVSTAPSSRPPLGHPDHPPERQHTTRTYRVEGDQIVLDAQKTIAGTCHHCAIETCRGAQQVTP